MDPEETRELVEGSKLLKSGLYGEKGPIVEEKDVIDFAYASVVSIKTIKKGEKLSRENLWVKRPGTGPFFAKDYDSLIGRSAARDIPSDKHIEIEDFS